MTKAVPEHYPVRMQRVLEHIDQHLDDDPQSGALERHSRLLEAPALYLYRDWLPEGGEELRTFPFTASE